MKVPTNIPAGVRPRRSRRSRFAVAALGALAVGGVLATMGAGLASAKKASSSTIVCQGSSQAKPGVLTGKIAGNVLVKGFCAVNQGPATVAGSVTVAPGAILGAVFGLNHKTHRGVSNLSIAGNLVVGNGATALVGCEATQFPCVDDPNQKAPTLNNHVTIGGNVVVTGALGVVIHDAMILGKVSQDGGGGGQNCTPTGIFKVFMSPAYSDYEDSAIAGSLSIKNMHSCWLGVQRVYVGAGLTVTNNAMADPDAIEIGHNLINGNLACSGNTNSVPASAAVWDTSDAAPGALYPRVYKPNIVVHGTRSGQCNSSTPVTAGGPSGAPGSF
ncbi:MAG TPA: hypothetical protein VGX45_00770 [Solirubrobacteraceae bacterium]|nr:hypothetical protein [Solirubrobacteraceae bacterium]